MVFIALLLFDTQYPVDIAVSVLMSLVGIFNVVVHCMAPQGALQSISLFNRAGKDKGSDNSSNSDVES